MTEKLLMLVRKLDREDVEILMNSHGVGKTSTYASSCIYSKQYSNYNITVRHMGCEAQLA